MHYLIDINSIIIKKDSWFTVLDFKDAYFHFSVHKKYRKYFRFRFAEQVFQCTVLPFGLVTASKNAWLH